MKRTAEDIVGETELRAEQCRAFRSICMRISCLALDRPELLYSAKRLARHMSRPTTVSWSMAKRLGRFLLQCPRIVQRMVMQPVQRVLTAKVDSDYAGCPTTRRSTTGRVAYHGGHAIMFGSTTQRVAATSNGES